MTADLPGRAIDDAPQGASPHAAYLALLDAEVLIFQGCRGCRAAVFPPRQRCSLCGADELSWRRSEGFGTVYSTTVIRPRNEPAYCVALVDLDEGFRMMSNVIETDADQVHIDDRVEVRFLRDGDQVLPLFAPASGGPR